MSNSNDYMPFGTGTGANVMTTSDYSALSARATGFQSGVALSIQYNKVWRQSSVVSAMIGQFTADYGPGNVVDDGNVSNLETQFKAALTAYFGGTFLPLAGGTLTGPVWSQAPFYLATGSSDTAGTYAAINFGDFVSGSYRTEYNISLPAGSDGSRALSFGRFVSNTVVESVLTLQSNGRVGLAHDPVANLDAVTKQYVDTSIAAVGGNGLVAVMDITSSATVTIPTSATRARIRVWGAGGGGGGSGVSVGAAGCGGGGGEYREGLITGLTGGGTLSATVGAGGGGGAGSSSASGGAGGWSSFAGMITAGGGGGGGGSSSGLSPYTAGGTGGTGGTGGSLAYAGSGGEAPFGISTSGVMLGTGGPAWGCAHSHFGVAPTGTTLAGAAGVYPGQGGGGGCGSGAGGSGANGLIIVEFFA